MESVFRFALVRQGIPADNPIRVELARKSGLQSSLIDARSGEKARDRMIAIAQTFAGTPGLARDYKAYTLGAAWSGLAQLLAQKPAPSLDDLRVKIQQLFGHAPDALISDATFTADDTLAADTIIVVRIVKAEQRGGFGVAPTVVRLAELVRAIVRNDPGVEPPADALRWVLVPPPTIFPLPNPTRASAPAPAPDPRKDEIAALSTRIAASKAALDEMMTLESTTSSVEDALPAVHPTVLARAAQPTGAPKTTAPPLAQRTETAFTLVPSAIKTLSSGTQAVLADRGLEPGALSLDRVANGLARGLNLDARRLAELSPNAAKHIRVVGSTPIPVTLGTWDTGPMVPVGGPTPPPVVDPPTSHGDIRSVGVSDLLVVKQQLKRYEAIDVAHIENVLKGESMDRQHVNSTVTEQFTLNQTETTTATEQDFESTDRFEMSRQVNETIKQDASLKAGLTVSGSYGPTVDFSASMEGAVDTSREQATTQATKYARDVTTRTAKSVSEKVLQQTSLKITTTVSDTSDHKIDNTAGDANVVGVYQWVDKVYEAQVFNYGMRALFDFSVPEPAAFAIAAMKSQYADATELRKPVDFYITPAMINEINYPSLALEWEASGISPPPEPFVTLSKTFHGGPDSADAPTKGFFDDAAEVPLPDGYSAVYCTSSALYTMWEDDAAIDVAIGSAVHRFSNNGAWTWNVAMTGEVASLAIAVKTFHTATYALTIEIKCQRTPRAMDKWRNDTYNQLLQAFQAQRSAYEDKLAALKARVGVEISGRNPDANRQIEKTELKRACIAILTAQNYEVFGSLTPGADGLPNIDLDKAALEGPYIRFFEQAFEWENITYIYYPYFWAKRDTWLERFNYDDVDPLFSRFLQAGEARVVAPVRPGFAVAVAHFLATGEIWDGGDLPVIGDPLYTAIIDELRESLGAPGTEVPQGDPWDVRIATNLVLLREDGKLPSWTKQADGSWKPD